MNRAAHMPLLLLSLRLLLLIILHIAPVAYAASRPPRGYVPRPKKRNIVTMQVNEETGETKEWTPSVSLELFEHRKKHGPPLTRRDRHHEVALRRQVMQQYYDDKREAERLVEEAKKPRKPHSLLCGETHCIVAGLKIHIEHQKGLFFCKDCPHPALEGSWVDLWESHYNPHEFSVGGALVFAVPNDGSDTIMNDEDVRGRIALMKRGGVALNTKVRHAQEAGALAVLILNSNCTLAKDGLRCEAERKERAYGHGFSISDPPNHWSGLKIPAGILSVKDGKRIVNLMDLERMDMGGTLGVQYYDKHLNN